MASNQTRSCVIGLYSEMTRTEGARSRGLFKKKTFPTSPTETRTGYHPNRNEAYVLLHIPHLHNLTTLFQLGKLYWIEWDNKIIRQWVSKDLKVGIHQQKIRLTDSNPVPPGYKFRPLLLHQPYRFIDTRS